MRLTHDAIIKIDEGYYKRFREQIFRHGVLGCNIRNRTNEASVYSGDNYLFDVCDLKQAIEELTLMYETIKEEIGVC